MIKKISPAQKTIIITSLIIVFVFLLFWFLIYLPSKREVTRIKSELSNLEYQIRQIEAITSEVTLTDEGIRMIRAQYERLNNKFPQKEERSIGTLSDIASNLNIELVSIKPQFKTVFLDRNKKEIKIEGRVCQRVYVTIEMKGLYKDLVKYIQTLKESLPAFISIEKLKIVKDRLQAPRLNVILEFNLFLLS